MQENDSKGRCNHEITSESVMGCTPRNCGVRFSLKRTLTFPVIPAVKQAESASVTFENKRSASGLSISTSAFWQRARQRRIGRDLGDLLIHACGKGLLLHETAGRQST
jgi:hypothetical protein